MRLLVICSHYPPHASPEGLHACLLCEELARSGVEVHLITSPLLPGAPAPRDYSIHATIVSWDWSGALRLTSEVARLDPDCILLIYIGWIYGYHPMVTHAPTFLRVAFPDIHFVTQFENVQGARATSRRGSMVSRAISLFGGYPRPSREYGTLLSGSNAVIALSEHHLGNFKDANTNVGGRLVVIPVPPLCRIVSGIEGSARATGRARLGLRKDDSTTIILTYFGYVYPGKGVETLISAFAILSRHLSAESTAAIRLVIVGEITDADLKKRIASIEQDAGLHGQITWLGYLENEEASTYLRATDIAILPFDSGIRLNNSSFAVCAAHGLPIITTRGEELETVFKHGENVFLCPPKDAAGLAHAITALASSISLRRSLGQGSLGLAETIFSWHQAVKATLPLLENGGCIV